MDGRTANLLTEKEECNEKILILFIDSMCMWRILSCSHLTCYGWTQNVKGCQFPT